MSKTELFTIDPDITRAETLPSRFYNAETYFAESKERIFARSWQFVGLADDLTDLNPRTILEGFIDEPILITKQNKKLRCLSNVCTHRGNILVEKECRAKGIRCGYHGRRFSPDGKFQSMPEFEDAIDFPTKKDDLKQLPFSIWRDFLFVSLDPFAPLEEFVSEMDACLAGFDFDNLRFVSAKDYEIKAHWALYCENYVEGFHIPYVHKTLNDAIDYGSYTTDTFRFSSVQTALSDSSKWPAPAVSEPPAVAGGLTHRSDPFDCNRAAYYFFVFPNLMFNFYPWGLSVNVVNPLKKDLTKITFLTYVSDESKLGTGAGIDLHRVELEDERVVENVQKGIRSRFYDRGRYSPTREQGTHHFHRLIAEFMER